MTLSPLHFRNHILQASHGFDFDGIWNIAQALVLSHATYPKSRFSVIASSQLFTSYFKMVSSEVSILIVIQYCSFAPVSGLFGDLFESASSEVKTYFILQCMLHFDTTKTLKLNGFKTNTLYFSLV